MSVEFIDLYKDVHEKTLLTPDRLWYVWYLPRTQVENNIEGQFAELGVFQGGSAKMIYQSVHGAVPIHLFDTFEGIPEKQLTDHDYHIRSNPLEEAKAQGMMGAGAFSSPIEQTIELFKDRDNVFVYKGMFPETADPVKDVVFSFVHIDMDIYVPVLEALKFFYGRLSLGGIMVVDDYGHLNGATKAVDEFAEAKGLKIRNTAFMQCALRKPFPETTENWDPNNILWQFK